MPAHLIRQTRPHVAPAPLGPITQGTVFNCATAFRYAGKEVFGLTITARCDVAQEKYRLLNYVPTVALDDWLLVDGLDILIRNERKDHNGRIKNELKQAGLSPNLSDSVSLDNIISINFSCPNSDKKTKAAKNRLDNLAIEIDTFEKLVFDSNKDRFKTTSSRNLIGWFISTRPKAIQSLIKDLFDHKVLGYYLLEKLHYDAESTGHVCLLREVSSLPQEIAEELARGISNTRWVEINADAHVAGLNFDIDDFACPIAQIESPTIEHIMQTYANLFGRIGIADADPEEIEQVLARYQHKTESDS